MTESIQPSASESDPLAAEVLEALANKLQAGELVDALDLERYIAEHPAYAERLRRLLPTVEVLAELGRSGASAPDDVAEVSATSAKAPCMLGDFRIVREIGRGGMGVVYEAEQVSLCRRVALKVLPFAAALDSKQLQRFKNEAQAAAHLHHQNIVPVYAVGCERGVHYYAMQFIDGHTLAEVIAELRLQAGLRTSKETQTGAPSPEPELTGPYLPTSSEPETAPASTAPRAQLSTETSVQSSAYFRSVAQLGVQAAEALEHAHQLGVIHRDIKPGNLMVEGEPGVSGPGVHLWIADFGLAQVQSDTKLTMTGDLVGTLRYMSPEQALAKRVVIDHRTDIYSLGVTLYELLTLEPAFTGRDRQELLSQIAFDEPRPPRRLNKSIPWELETIVLKAIAKAPAERYATAQELADDLRRFLDDRPILARRPTLGQKAAKWARRHRTLVWAATVFLAFAAAGSATSAALFYREYRRAERGEADAREQTDLAEEETAKARKQERLAKEEAERATANLRLSLAVLEKKYLQVAERWAVRDLRREVEDRAHLEDMLGFYEEFARLNSADPAARKDAARAHLRVGSLRLILKQDTKAQEALEKARRLYAQLHEDYPDEPEYRERLAEAHRRRGILFQGMGRLKDAHQAYREAIPLLDKLIRDYPNDQGYKAFRATCRREVGDLLVKQGQLKEAEQVLCRARDQLGLLADAVPDAPEYRLQLALTCDALGKVLHERGRWKEAGEAYRLGRDQARKLVNAFPKEARYRYSLALREDDLGKYYHSAGRLVESDQAFRAAIGHLEQIEPDYLNLPEYWHNRTMVLGNYAEFLGRTGRHEQAAQIRLQAERFHVNVQHLARQFGNVPSFREGLAVSQAQLAILEGHIGHNRKAEELDAQAVAAFTALAKEFPDQPIYKDQLSRTLSNLGEERRRLNRPADAVKDLRKALKIHEALVKRYPQASDYRASLVLNLHNLATALTDLKITDEAERLHRRVIAMYERRDEAFPADRLETRRIVGSCYGDLGAILLNAGRTKEAKDVLERAVAMARELVRECPLVPDYHYGLGVGLRNLGVLRREEGDLGEARRLLEQAIDHGQQSVAPSRRNPRYRLTLASHSVVLGQLLLRLKEPEKAEEAFAQCLALAKELITEFPEDVDYQRQLAGCYQQFAMSFQEASHFSKAVECYQQAQKTYEAMAERFPFRAEEQEQLASVHYRRGYCHHSLGKVAEAERDLNQAGLRLDKLRKEYSKEPRYQQEYAGVRNELGMVLLFGTDRIQDADKPLREALSIREELVRAWPAKALYQREWADSHNNVGLLDQLRKDNQTAAVHFHKAIDILTALPALDADSHFLLGGALQNLATTMSDQREYAKANQLLLRAIEHQRQARKTDPENLQYRTGLRNHYQILGQNYFHLGERDALAKLAEEFPPLFPDGFEEYLRAARFLGDCVVLADADTKLSDEQRKELVQKYLERSRALRRKGGRRLPRDPEMQNALAWTLATCPDKRFRDPAMAVELAKKAVALAPQKGDFWNTLGAAHYRAESWKEAEDALRQSMKLRAGGDSFDWFVLAMTLWQRSDKDEARKWFDRAVHWMKKNSEIMKLNKEQTEQLESFHAEAAVLLGVKDSHPKEK
jgi:serine/threonine protein kinase